MKRKIYVFYFLIICFLTNLNNSYCQEFLALNNGLDYSTNCIDLNKFDLVRTDQDGNVVWTLSFKNQSQFFDYIQDSYIVMSKTSIMNGRILDNPSDYDYWLTPKFNPDIFSVFPNPNQGVFDVLCSELRENLFYEIYDSSSKLISKGDIVNSITRIDIKDFSKGFYFIKFSDNKNNLKTNKICVL